MRFNIFRWRSLKTRMTLFTLAIFLASLWLLALYASRVLHQDMQRMLGDQQFSTATFVAAEVNDDLVQRLKALEMFSKALTPALLGNTVNLQAALEQRSLLLSLFNAGIVVLDPDGKVIVGVPLSAGRSGLNLMDRDYVAAALREGKSTVGRPVPAKQPGGSSVDMAVPIHDAQGRIIGAVAGLTRLDAANFLDNISQGHYGKTGGYLLAAPQYRLFVTASDKRRVMEEFPAPGVDPLIDRRVQGLEGTEVFVNPHGVEVLSSTKRVPVTGWFVVVSLPTEEAFAPIRDVRHRLLLATLLLTLLAGGLCWWVVRRQLSPMLASVKALAVLSQSNLHPQPLPISREDEIGELIGGFNRLLAELGQREEQVRQLAFYDPLTKLPNRRLLNDRLTQALADSKRSGRYGALMFLDLDNFKALNDAHGHGAGDLLLMQAADRLKKCVREVDTVVRLGGDEFVVMVGDLNADKAASNTQAGSIAEKIRAALAEPYRLTVKHDGQADAMVEHQCSASIGVVLFIDHEGSQEDFLRWADAAMYQAKETGSNLIRFHSPSRE